MSIIGWMGKPKLSKGKSGFTYTRTRSFNNSAKNSESSKNSFLLEDHYLSMIRDEDLRVLKKDKKFINRCAYLLQSLEGKTIKTTALHVDIVNSTEKVRTLSSEAAGMYYQAFIESASDLIEDYGGYVLKNVGDCVLGFFPCSNYYIENHDKAVLCGLAISDMIKDSLSPYFAERNLPSIACRISADYGAAKVLRVGSNGDYSAVDLFGGALNSASKISHYAKPNQMVIGDNLFWELIHSKDFEFKSIRNLDLMGKQIYPVYVVERCKCKIGGDNDE